jgi:NADPH2:quinone reductase
MMPIPEATRVIEIAEPGGPDVLRVATRPTPVPREGEVLIRVEAAGVNYPDTLQRRGRYALPPGASDIPGLEVAGTIARVGEGVDAWRVGDRVCALLAGGGYAEYCVAPAPQCLPIPAGMDAITAAAIPETFFTVWTNVFESGALKAGETFLVHGGSSGIGTTAIQLARAFGARVFATAGSPDKCAACERLGAERAINYRDEDFVAAIKPLTADRGGVDLILDMVGGDYVARNLDLLAPRGRLVQIAFLKSPKVEVDLSAVMRKRLIVTGSLLRPRTVAEKGAIAEGLRTHVWPLLERGVVRPVIHATFPLEQASQAHRTLEEGSHIGKVVLESAGR